MFSEKIKNYIKSKHQVKRNKQIRFEDLNFNFNIKQNTTIIQIRQLSAKKSLARKQRLLQNKQLSQH